tara:strand:+ start:650 stop:1213 length:564 start_codon:yes stop_codon:yes gene_type:complete
MKYDKFYLRKKFLSIRKNNHKKVKKFNFKIIFNLIKKHFGKKKIIIAGYYPANYEVNILNFLEEASKKKHKIVLPVIKSLNKMNFCKWIYKEPLYVSRWGILEPKNSKDKAIPDIVIVPLVAFDEKLNRIGYGKGYYDRALKKISKIKKKTIFIGIAYSFQKYKKIPINKHDYKLDYIFTERGIIRK